MYESNDSMLKLTGKKNSFVCFVFLFLVKANNSIIDRLNNQNDRKYMCVGPERKKKYENNFGVV